MIFSLYAIPTKYIYDSLTSREMSGNGNGEVHQRLKSIQLKLRDIEQSNAAEVIQMQHQIDLATEKYVTLQKLTVDQKEYCDRIDAENTRLHLQLRKSESSCEQAVNERDQLQQSLSHMEGLLTASRSSFRNSESTLSETQRNYESRIEELESKVSLKSVELKSSVDANTKLKRSISDLHAAAAQKDSEISMLQEIIRRECVERTNMQERLARFDKGQNHDAERLRIVETIPNTAQDVFAPKTSTSGSSRGEEDVQIDTHEDLCWKKLTKSRKR